MRKASAVCLTTILCGSLDAPTMIDTHRASLTAAGGFPARRGERAGPSSSVDSLARVGFRAAGISDS